MQVDDLLAYDLVPSEVAALRALIKERLGPLSALAVRRGILGGGRGGTDMLVSGTAGSGKSTLLTLLFQHAAHRGEQALLIRPRQAAGRALLRRLCFEPDSALLRSVDLVLIDDLESLRNREERPLLIGLLRKLQLLKQDRATAARAPRLIAASLPLEGLAALADQLGAELISDAAPPLCGVPSFGALCDGRIVYPSSPHCGAPPDLRFDRACAAPRLEDEALLMAPPQRLPASARLIAMLEALCRRAAPMLLLFPDEQRAIRMAERLWLLPGAHELRRAPSHHKTAAQAELLLELEETAPGRARALLAALFRQGVALWSSSLSARQQDIVERAVRSGAVRFVCASEPPELERLGTPFRAAVVFTRRSGRDERRGARAVRGTLDRLDFLRLASRCQGGPVLLYARSPREAAALLARHVDAPPRPLLPRLRLVADSARETVRTGSLFAPAGGPDAILLAFRQWAEASREAVRMLPPVALEVFYLVAAGLPARGLPLSRRMRPQVADDACARFRARASEQGVAERPLFGEVCEGRTQVSTRALRAAVQALLLVDFFEGLDGPSLERTYHVWLGAIERLAGEAADRILALCQVCAAAGWSKPSLDALQALALRLRSRKVDAIARHLAAPPPYGQAIGRLMGALHAKKTGDRPDPIATKRSLF